MEKRRRKSMYACQLLLLAVGLFFIIPLNAQDLCVENLEQAQRNFNEGRFYDVEPLLSKCIKSGFNRQERIEAMELLATTKMFLDELDEADSIYLNLLRIDPEHQVNEEADPPDLIFLHNSFRTNPLFHWSLIAGGNISNPSVIHNYSMFSDNDQDENYSNSGGMEMGIGFEMNIKKKLYAGLEMVFAQKRFKYSDIALDRIHSISYINVGDWINIPAYLKYYFGEGKWSYYGYLGPQFDYLLANRYVDLLRNPRSASQIEQSKNVVSDRRYNVNYSFVMGAGIRYKTNGISLFVFDIKINPGLTNLVNESKRFSDMETNIFFGLVDDVYRINSISFTIRFMQPYYNPKKLKQFSR